MLEEYLSFPEMEGCFGRVLHSLAACGSHRHFVLQPRVASASFIPYLFISARIRCHPGQSPHPDQLAYRRAKINAACACL